MCYTNNMNNISIKKTTRDSIVVEIPLWQDTYDCTGRKCGKAENIIGVISGNNQGFCNLIDMSYKGKNSQIGDFIVKTTFSNAEFEKLCKRLGVSFYEYPICAYCFEPIFGAFGFGKKGNRCYPCELKSKN